MEPEGSVFGRHRQYSLYRVSASRVLHQFAWEGFLWCCGKPKQIGEDFFTNQYQNSVSEVGFDSLWY